MHTYHSFLCIFTIEKPCTNLSQCTHSLLTWFWTDRGHALQTCTDETSSTAAGASWTRPRGLVDSAAGPRGLGRVASWTRLRGLVDSAAWPCRPSHGALSTAAEPRRLSRPWMQTTTDHQPHSQHVSVNKIWRRIATTPWCRRSHTQLAENSSMTLCTRFYHSRPSFVEDMTKKSFWLKFFVGHGVSK